MKLMLKNKGNSYIMDWVNPENGESFEQGNKMKSILKLTSKVMSVALMITGMLVTTSCGAVGEKEEVTTISIEKDGTVRSHIEESFEQSYYDKDELQQMILVEVADYNRKMGNGNIAVEKVEVEKGTATVEMTYQKAADYAAFNKVVFFDGTAQEALDAGYELNIVLSGVKDSQETIGKADLLNMEDYRLLITDVAETVNLSGKAEFMNESVAASENRRSVKKADTAEGLAYILYK